MITIIATFINWRLTISKLNDLLEELYISIVKK